jgi:hypothetical protein
MSNLEILMLTVHACAVLWIVYRVGYHFGRVRGIESSMSFIDSELKRLKKILEDKIDATEHTTK